MPKLSDLYPLVEEVGFDAVGVAELGEVGAEERIAFDKWITEGKQGEMGYLSRNLPLRYDPSLEDSILRDAKSVIVVAASYYPRRLQPADAPQISKYAYGADYHLVLRERLDLLGTLIEERIGSHSFRPIVDTVPFLERYWAQKAGIGFIGRNRNLIIRGKGSFFFLGELLTTMTFEGIEEHVTTPPGAFCGACHRCIEHCPTQALSLEGLDARRCVSYLTIEHRGEVPSDLRNRLGNRLYGCDTCQDVCPFNHRPTTTRLFEVRDEVLALTDDDLRDFTKDKYRRLVKDSALERARYDRMSDNVALYLENNKSTLPPG